MIYFHSWMLSYNVDLKSYNEALLMIKKIIDNSPIHLSGGFLGRTPFATVEDGVCFSGLRQRDDGSFVLKADAQDRYPCNACRTDKEPFDLIVTAALTVLHNVLSGQIRIASTGTAEDWEYGVRLAEKILDRKFDNPMEKETE